ncbi:MAG: SLC13/DASS family transporter [Negativicutes bacterium]|mgnify:FL=1|jgi:anion transporter|nr:SLC13/DASS family transporter [Negativicutes bacterium]
MSKAVMTLCVVGVVAILFVTEMIPLAVTAMSGAIVIGLLGILPAGQVFSGLSDGTVVLFAGMFIIGASMFHTGLAQRAGEAVVRAVGTGENALMFGTMMMAGVMSSISSNTGTTAALMPVVIGICATAKISASRQLMPLALAAGAGGIITLIGTPPNIIAAGALTAAGLPTFTFLEFAWIGVPLLIVTIVYMMFIGKYLLPKGEVNTNVEIDAEAAAEAKASTSDPKKQVITAVVLVLVVLIMAFEPQIKTVIPMTLAMAAVMGAIILVLTKCLTEKQAYQGIDWVTIFLFAGMMPIATAMEKSGAGRLIADGVVGVMGGSPSPLMVTAVLFILSCGLTQVMSNTACTALLAPIGISIALKLGADPKAVLMAIAVASSCAFATPVGTPPNTLVLGPGGYKFMDYVKVGTPLIVLCFIVSIIIIPIVWPFGI